MTPRAWQGLKYPDSDLVGLLYRYARPGRDVPAESPRAIDVGCGPGRHVKLLADLGYQALGLDNDEEMCRIARSNGVKVICGPAQHYHPPQAPDVVVAWGFMMLVANGPQLVASWGPTIAVVNWRSPANTFFGFAENITLPSGAVRVQRTGHTLDGQEMFAHDLTACQIPGYQRIHDQLVTRTTDGEQHAWYQTVHRKAR